MNKLLLYVVVVAELREQAGLSVDQGSQCILTPKTVQSTSLSFQSVYVYMRKLAPPLVSYRLFDFVSRLHDDLVISYLVI